ncbi:excinuclease ABC subunit UvrB [Chloracidobacterium aggregatum]|uniref:UvrABC system protein B n=1 Tax=Chloracidobacterium sp. N TaxID=2821540 RepID=A0ABX8B2I6_9BACT|nr:excinuclease ABC subunit UvrB [Chloracidobacterium aggregatum]QUV84875.1 excinuclease ABC subunit UvrB [Chloracidobacterium sp. 2]QUV88721.1 excinuclease ABC subunit UvrB [Chloracidobacterium sp. S]QUV91640.1 excinuclease ABC subunit UvrB [Chloracidobacterium sp. A]QUV94817.1 excinuclease ABC subunit UvrB [Chloracidobacterium sp. N]QUV95928.1 excinuclease ABC subunit UvrB [Chloracidobacterium sp. E]
MPFELVAPYVPCGDQPAAIETLTNNFRAGAKYQTLLGITGSGKTFTVANVIARLQRPALVMAHNKTLAAQLYQEFKGFFPHNAVEYFVSYYDYYQPEAYVPSTDTYIEKEATINDEIDRLRLAATRAAFERRDFIIVTSVSCIYGIGDPDAYFGMICFVEPGQPLRRNKLIERLVELQYDRDDEDFARGTFRVRGDTVEVHPSYTEQALRIAFWGDEVDTLELFDPLLGETLERIEHKYPIYPKSHYVTPKAIVQRAVGTIRQELDEWEAVLLAQGKTMEAQRLRQRTMYDLEMMKALGFCRGIENYSRHLTGRPPGAPPPTLFDYLPEDTLIVVDESHQTIPQVRGMYAGDRSRKQTLVDFGFRLPSALDNRPLNFAEWEQQVGQVLFVSATPGPYELACTGGEVVEQIIRPTGLLDPLITVRPVRGQIDDLLGEIRQRIARGERSLVMTLTKKMAEDLTDYYTEVGLNVRYLHSDIETLERIKIIRDLRRGDFDVLVGVNLLREGMDLPEVSLVAILDADKEGFLRSEASIIQIIGRAARHVHGQAMLYADRVTESMRRAMEITARRRQLQETYNREHGITPRTVIKPVEATLVTAHEAAYFKTPPDLSAFEAYTPENLAATLVQLETEMRAAAKALEFEKAAALRDKIKYLKSKQLLAAES